MSGLVFSALDQALHDEADRRLFRQIVARVDKAVCLEWFQDDLPSVNFDRQRAAVEATKHLLSLEQGQKRACRLNPPATINAC